MMEILAILARIFPDFFAVDGPWTARARAQRRSEGGSAHRGSPSMFTRGIPNRGRYGTFQSWSCCGPEMVVPRNTWQSGAVRHAQMLISARETLRTPRLFGKTRRIQIRVVLQPSNWPVFLPSPPRGSQHTRAPLRARAAHGPPSAR